MFKFLKVCFFGTLGIIMLCMVVSGISNALMTDEEKAEREEILAKEKKINDSILLVKEKEKNDRYLVYRLENLTIEGLKSSMKDPQSFEVVSKNSGYYRDSTIYVEVKYRATNSFGAYIQDNLSVKYNKDGELINYTQ